MIPHTDVPARKTVGMTVPVEPPSTVSPAAPPTHRVTRRRSLDVLGIVAVLLIVLLVVFISASDGLDYIHGFGKACLVVHDGWHFHVQCGGSVSPPNP